MSLSSGIWRWADRIDPGGEIPPEARITMGEGPAPLVQSVSIGPQAGADLWFLDLTGQPTLSYKASFAAAAISHMIANGRSRALLTSSGNTGSAVAAYCARARLECVIVISDGTPTGKVRKMAAAGARIVEVERFGADPAVTGEVLEILKRECEVRNDTALLVSNYLMCPQGMVGAETFAYFLDTDGGMDHLEHLFIPAGSGALALAVARGFAHAAVDLKPAIHLVQPAGCDTLATCLREGRTGGDAVDKARTAVTGIKVPFLLDAAPAIDAARASGGTGFTGSDAEIYATQARLAAEEGILAEPAGAAAVMGALKAVAEGAIGPGERAICLITGSAFNDEEAFARLADTNQPQRLPVEKLAMWTAGDFQKEEGD